MMRKSAAVQGFRPRGVVKSCFGTQIPASIEALITCVHAPRGLIAARVAANPKLREALKLRRPNQAGPQH
jgi:hypothetical protein